MGRDRKCSPIINVIDFLYLRKMEGRGESLTQTRIILRPISLNLKGKAIFYFSTNNSPDGFNQQPKSDDNLTDA